MEKKSTKIHGKGVVNNLGYHLVWTTKRRQPVLKGLITEDLRKIFADKSREMGLDIQAMEILSDHVHVFINGLPKLSPHRIVKSLKSASSLILRKKYPQLTKMPCLWSSSYYCGSVGCVADSVVKLYIENQRGK